MSQQPFDPGQFISKVQGRDYLEVKWRIAWMRSDHPDAILDTELMSHTGDRAIMRAIVTFPGGGSATGWGSETASSFENYIEKAETKAIGRALTALGYGTPVSESDDVATAARNTSSQNRPTQQPNSFMATGPQKSKIYHLANELQIDRSELDSLVHQHTGGTISELNRRQASGVIDLLEARRPVAQPAS